MQHSRHTPSYLLALFLSLVPAALADAAAPEDPALSADASSLAYALEGRTDIPTTHTTGDGKVLPIQREWVVPSAPGEYDDVPVKERPFRVNQRFPRFVHKEERPGTLPLYYFENVRWLQEAGRRDQGGFFLSRVYYTTVKIDLTKVKAAYYCLKPFKPKIIAGHAALYLEMEPGGLTTLDGEDSTGFVISYEAHIRADQKYGLLKGQLGAYPNVYVAGTWKDFLFRSLTLDHPLTLKRWKLALTPDELTQLGIHIGRTVIEADPTDHYNTLFDSCVHAAVKLLNGGLSESRRVALKWGFVPNPELVIPSLTYRSLARKGLIDGDLEEIMTFEEGLAASP